MSTRTAPRSIFLKTMRCLNCRSKRIDPDGTLRCTHLRVAIQLQDTKENRIDYVFPAPTERFANDCKYFDQIQVVDMEPVTFTIPKPKGKLGNE